MALYASLNFGLWHDSVEARKQPIPAFIEHMRGRELPPQWLSSYLHRFAKQRDFWPVRRLNSYCRIAAFARQPILQVFVSLITRYRDAIAHTLRTDAVYSPG
jgi:hypothetical protein